MRRTILLALFLSSIHTFEPGIIWGQEQTGYVKIDCNQAADTLEVTLIWDSDSALATHGRRGPSGIYELSKYFRNKKELTRSCKLKSGVLVARISPMYVCKGDDPPTFTLNLKREESDHAFIDLVFSQSCSVFTENLSINSVLVSGRREEITIAGTIRTIPFQTVYSTKSPLTIVAHKIKPDQFSSNASADLLRAALQGNSDSIKAILDRGAEIESRNGIGETALMLAVEKDHFGTVKELVSRGADVNAVDELHGAPVLMRTVRNKSADVMRYLIQHGARVDERSSYEDTTLIRAARIGNANAVDALLESHAQPNIEDNQGLTALLWATMTGSPYMGSKDDYNRTIQLLASKGANVNVKTKNGDSVLAIAARNPWTSKDTFNVLVSKTTDPSNIEQARVIAETQNKEDLIEAIKIYKKK